MLLGTSIMTIIPTLILVGYAYYKDRLEREPLSSVAMAFGLGIISFVLSFFIERLIIDGIGLLYKSKIIFSDIGLPKAESEGVLIRHNILCAFIGVALTEEGIKWLGLNIFAKKSKQFDCFYDGIVYSAFISLGFAVSECVRYTVVGEQSLLLLRAFSLIPSHIFFGIFMGVFYTIWKTHKEARALENELLKKQKIKSLKVKKATVWVVLSILIPFFAHGLFQYVAFSHNSEVKELARLLAAFLYILSFIVIRHFSDDDDRTNSISGRLVRMAHPEWSDTEEDENNGK